MGMCEYMNVIQGVGSPSLVVLSEGEPDSNQ